MSPGTLKLTHISELTKNKVNSDMYIVFNAPGDMRK